MNYYWKSLCTNLSSRQTIQCHIGQMVLIGPYCTECGIVPCKGGSRYALSREPYFSEQCLLCPSCDKKTTDMKHTYKMIWTMMSHERKIRELATATGSRSSVDNIIIDSNGTEYTCYAFYDLYSKMVSFHEQLAASF